MTDILGWRNHTTTSLAPPCPFFLWYCFLLFPPVVSVYASLRVSRDEERRVDKFRSEGNISFHDPTSYNWNKGS